MNLIKQSASLSFISFLLSAMLLTSPASASDACGLSPQTPAMLSSVSVTTDQLESLSQNFEGYSRSVAAYIECLEAELARKAPMIEGLSDEEINSPEFLDSAEYTTYMSALLDVDAKVSALDTQLEVDTNTYNRLVISAEAPE